jgi:hypothetical protein
MIPGLVIAGVLAGAIAAGAWWWRWLRDRPQSIRYREAELGRFEVGAWEGVLLAADASFHLEPVRGPGGARSLVGVARDGDQHKRRPLDQFPLRTQRLEIELVATGRRPTFEAHERTPSDDEFMARPRDGEPRRTLTPLCPPSWLWEGIRIQAPRELHYQRSIVPPSPGVLKPAARLIIAGVYMARQASLRAADSDWAFSSGASPMLVLRDLSTGAELQRATLDRISGDYRALVQGLSISYALPTRPPAVADDDSRREGAPFVVDVGFYLKARTEPWDLGVHAELGPLRSNDVVIHIHP